MRHPSLIAPLSIRKSYFMGRAWNSFSQQREDSRQLKPSWNLRRFLKFSTGWLLAPREIQSSLEVPQGWWNIRILCHYDFPSVSVAIPEDPFLTDFLWGCFSLLLNILFLSKNYAAIYFCYPSWFSANWHKLTS